mmetsp:Transcript_6474/g.7579  ORF Transcript_6474/g.7579 Transcript_6474/m.7579 type:complete len:190 (+) Transcript_6474:76-645(+)
MSFGMFWSLVLALPVAQALPPCEGIHTWHNVTAWRGTWKAQLSSISEHSLFYDANCKEMGASPTFEVVGGKEVASGSATFGFKIGPDDDFDVAYSLTLVRSSPEPLNPKDSIESRGSEGSSEGSREGSRKLFKSMACSYVIAAAGPAQPDVRAEPFNGATCMWERTGHGENYQVDFSPETEHVSATQLI